MRKWLMQMGIWRLFVVMVVLGWVAGAALPVEARRLRSRGEQFVVYTADVVALRPAFLAVTVAGAGIYVATLPFHFFSGDSRAFEVLIGEPAKATFTRCVGCEPGEERP